MFQKNSLEFLENLRVTQFGLRKIIYDIGEMADIAQNGPLVGKTKIAIIDTDDGNFWIRDGLHRCAAILITGRGLRAEEFTIEYFSYEQINSINLSVKYYTPFDLQTEVRLTNLLDFKKLVTSVKAEHQEEFIRQNHHLYKTDKLPYHNSLKSFLEHTGGKENDLYNFWNPR